jgi:NitT/TauT family transport system substrate-binding protein
VTFDRAVNEASAMPALSRRAALAGAGALALPHIARAADKLTVKLDFLPWGLHAAMHLANVNGWFRDAGLEVDAQDGRGSANTLQLVNAGQFDVGQIQVGLLSQAAASGAKLKAFAGFMRATDLSAIVPKDSPMTKVADVRGKSLVVFAASPWMPFLDLWLKAGGLTRDDVTVMMVDPAALFGTYISGRADVLLTPVGAGLPFTAEGTPVARGHGERRRHLFPELRSGGDRYRSCNRNEMPSPFGEVQQRAWAYLRRRSSRRRRRRDAGATSRRSARPGHDARANQDLPDPV